MDPRRKALTERWINQWNVKDSAGQLHRPHGIWTSEARLTVYVCFDSFPGVGRQANYLFTNSMQRRAKEWADAGTPPTMATLNPSSPVRDTGAGYKMKLKEFFLDRTEPLEPSPRDDSDYAVELVMEQLLRRRGLSNCRKVGMEDQLRGIDLMVHDEGTRYGMHEVPIEIKSRTRKQYLDHIFVQISETNPEQRF